MNTPHSKSEAKRLAVMQRVTWFATCECTGDKFIPLDGEAPQCVGCGAGYVAVPHVVEDRIRADEDERIRAAGTSFVDGLSRGAVEDLNRLVNKARALTLTEIVTLLREFEDGADTDTLDIGTVSALRQRIEKLV